MLTTTHAIWSYAIFRNFSKSKTETFIIVLSSILPDLEILFWVGMDYINRLFCFNPLNIDYQNLLYGSGISFWYWPLTLITNSILTTSIMVMLLSLLSKNKRTYVICWFVVVFHILLDAFTHKAGNMLFWPLSTTKYLGIFEFQELPKYIIALEQVLSFSLLFILLVYKRKHIVVAINGK